MARKKVETADLKPEVVRAELPKGWEYSREYVQCPKCGYTAKLTAVKALKRCPLCGEKAE